MNYNRGTVERPLLASRAKRSDNLASNLFLFTLIMKMMFQNHKKEHPLRGSLWLKRRVYDALSPLHSCNNMI